MSIPSAIKRCPACGYRLASPVPPKCPLCAFALEGRGETDADRTPYAEAYARGRRAWLSMCEWVWLADRTRMKHLALVRASSASRRFARTNLALLAIGAALFAASEWGWRWVSASPAIEQRDTLLPNGQGWVQAASMPPSKRVGLAPEVAVALWWNFPQAALAVVIGMVAALLLSWLVLLAIRGSGEATFRRAYRQQERLSAALHYGTAWLVPVAVGFLVLASRSVSYIGAMELWPWYPKEAGLLWGGSGLCILGLGAWWFWLIRLAATMPRPTRVRAAVCFLFTVPIFATGAAAAWYFGLGLLHDQLVISLRLYW